MLFAALSAAFLAPSVTLEEVSMIRVTFSHSDRKLSYGPIERAILLVKGPFSKTSKK